MRSYEKRGEDTLRPLVTKILIMYSLGERKKRVILENVWSNKGGFERSKIKGEKGYIFLYSWNSSNRGDQPVVVWSFSFSTSTVISVFIRQQRSLLVVDGTYVEGRERSIVKTNANTGPFEVGKNKRRRHHGSFYDGSYIRRGKEFWPRNIRKGFYFVAQR